MASFRIRCSCTQLQIEIKLINVLMAAIIPILLLFELEIDFNGMIDIYIYISKDQILN